MPQTQAKRGELDDLVDAMIEQLVAHCSARQNNQTCADRQLKPDDRCLVCKSAELHRRTMTKFDACIAEYADVLRDRDHLRRFAMNITGG